MLIAVPLAFELALLGTLFWLYKQAEEATRKEEQAKAVVAQTKKLEQAIFNTGVVFLALDAQNTNVGFERLLNKHLTETPEELYKLEKLVAGSRHNVERLNYVSRKLHASFDWINQSIIRSKEGYKLNMIQAVENKATLDSIVSVLNKISKEAESKQKPQAAEELKTRLFILLVFGIAMSILIALLLAFVFHAGTTRRLQALMINSVQLGEGKKLAPPLEGNDEIALLDRTFHSAADALEQAALQRAELERMKKQFVAMISHDLRTPISAVTSTLELLGANAWGQLTETGLKKVSMAETSLRHSIQLINNLLDLEKMESGSINLELKESDILKLINRARDSVNALAERKSITLELPETTVQIIADEFRIMQVLLNLLGNAIKFSPESTTVKVELEMSAGGVKVRIRDQGPGVPPEHQALVFERFHQSPQTSEKAKEGTGLGLAICKAIIEAHGGTIGVENNDSGGSCFWFKLKTADGDS